MRFRPGARTARWCSETVVTLCAVAACAPVPKHAGYSVAFYRGHPTVLTSMLARCTNDPGGLGRTPDCIDARVAARIESIGSLERLPPMGLPLKSAAGSPP